MIIDIAVVSLTMSLIILLLIVFSDLFGKKYKAKYRYVAWLLMAIRLLVPFRFDFGGAPIILEEPESLSRPINQISEIESGADENHGQDDKIQESNYANDKHPADNDKTVSKNKIYTFSIAQILTFIWAAGAVIFLSYHFIVLALFNTKVKKSLVHLKDNIYKTNLISSPMMLGFFKKKVLIPDVSLSERELELILLHENTHAKRGDMWYKLIIVAANAVHWFNPLVYLLSRRANRDLEYSCDDIVIKDMSTQERKEYSMTLLRFMQKTNKGEPL